MDAYASLLSPEFWVSGLITLGAFAAFVGLAVVEIRERLRDRGGAGAKPGREVLAEAPPGRGLA